jgi:prepilin-type N-terminal cleavage/methylation domain-containing protein
MVFIMSRHAPSKQLSRWRRIAESSAGFSLVEILIALVVLGTIASGAYIGFNAINTYAVSSRLYSEAQTAAQNQIDLVLSKEPFDITAAKISGSFDVTLNKIPLELMTVAELDAVSPALASSPPPTTNQYYPYYRDGSNPNVLKKQAFIYQDPVNGNVLVTGTLSTTITDATLTSSFINPNTDLNVRKANVTVTYTFRGRLYTVSMDTLRTADQ